MANYGIRKHPDCLDFFITLMKRAVPSRSTHIQLRYRLRDGSSWRDGVPEAPAPTVIPHRPCLTCSSTTFRVGPGKGPHIAELICTGCDRGGRWLSKADAVTMGVAA